MVLTMVWTVLGPFPDIYLHVQTLCMLHATYLHVRVYDSTVQASRLDYICCKRFTYMQRTCVCMIAQCVCVYHSIVCVCV
jgi:hypothetical protein